MNSYQSISQEEAKKIMDEQTGYLILDVREEDEFLQGHIDDAVCLSYLQIEEKAEQLFPDKEQMILVYCRSGRRSKIAAESLAKLGYMHILEFGGILSWPYEIIK